MILGINCSELTRVFKEMSNKEDTYFRTYAKKCLLKELGLKSISTYTYVSEEEIVAITNEKKFFLAAVKYGIQYKILD
jgi:hypothetical protein